MYVRPYIEDPVFLQPDDGEVEMLNPDFAKGVDVATKEEHYHHHGDAVIRAD